MAEIAKTDLFGTRSFGPQITTRVRITAGSRIPADLKDLEEAPALVTTDIVGDRLKRVEETRLENLKVTELRERLGTLGQETSGKKEELVARLEAAQAAAAASGGTTTPPGEAVGEGS